MSPEAEERNHRQTHDSSGEEDSREDDMDIPMRKSRSGTYEAQNRAVLPTGFEGGNLDKVRDILVGSFMRDHEKRISRMEERMLKEYATLRDEVRKFYDSLEGYIKQEVDSLSEQLKAEQNERAETARRQTRELNDLSDSVDKKLAQMSEQTSTAQRELRQLALDQSKMVADEMRQKYGEIAATLENQMQEIRTEKTDRAALSAILMEVAMRLNNEW